MIPWQLIISKLTGGLGAAVDLFARNKWARWGGSALLWTAIALGIGWTLRGSYGEPRTITQTVADTVFSQRTIREVDTVETTVPERVTIYRRDTVTVYRDTTITVPTGLASGFRLARPTPIQIDGRTITYTAYDPGSGRWTQQRYYAEEDPWAFDIGALAIGGPLVGIAPSLGIRYESTRLGGFYGTSTAGTIYGMSLSYVF